MNTLKTAQWPELKRGLVAILRGVKPEEIEEIAAALVEAGFGALEIPLNSPDPFKSIEKAVLAHGSEALIGAGTVLTSENVDQLAAAGGRLLVSPNINKSVMSRAAHHKMVTMPGVFTATDAFEAIEYGASGLKFFPANVLGPSGIKAIMAVLPDDLPIGAVGGVSDADFEDYGNSGISVFGLGSSIYKIGMSAKEVSRRAIDTIAAYDAVFG